MNKFREQISPIIFLLTFVDMFTWGGVNIFMGLIALYLSKKFEADVIEIVGIGLSVQFLFRSITQIPVGLLVDKIKKDVDEILFVGLGMSLMGIGIIMTVFINLPIQFYFIQAIIGTGSAINLVSWRKLFAKNLSRGKEGISYAITDTAVSLSIAFLTFLAGIIANTSGENFELVIIWTGIIMLLNNIWVVLIYIFNQNERVRHEKR